MFKKLLCLTLVAVLLNIAGVTVVRAQSQDDKQAQLIEKLRQAVRKLGVGEAARVEVKLNDGTKHKGYIRDAGEDSFVIVEAKTGAITTINYLDLKQIKGSNKLTAAKIGLDVVKGVAVVAAVVGGMMLLVYALMSGEN